MVEEITVEPYVECVAVASDRSVYTLALLRLLDDPDADRDRVAELISADPILVSRLLVLANSAWIGARSESTNVWDAARVLGFSMVRNLAAASLITATDSNSHLPPGFLEHSIAAAGGAAAVAKRVGGRVRDAWSIALLHDLGATLMATVHGDEWASGPDGHTVDDELARFGFDHGALGAAVLAHLRLPTLVCEAIRDHNQPASSACTPVSLTVRAGIALAELTGTPGCSAPIGPPSPFLRELDLEHEQDEIAADLESHANQLISLLG